MLLDLARDLVARHRWAQALAVLEPEASPDSPAALWAVLARAYLGAGRLRPAVQAARTALAKDGDDVEAIGAVVAVCLATKRQDEALVLARRAITLAPRSPGAWRAAGEVFAHRRMWDDARRCVDAGLRLCDDDEGPDAVNLVALGEAVERGRATPRWSPARLWPRGGALRRQQRPEGLSPGSGDPDVGP